MKKLDKDRKINLSFSAVSSFMDCKRKYWFSYVRYLELIAFQPQNVVGNCVHFGLFKLYSKEGNAVNEAIKMMESEKQNLRKKLELSVQQEQILKEQEYAIKGMLKAYALHYKRHIAKAKHIANELKMLYDIDKRTRLVIKMDNIKEVKKKRYVHEIKTAKSLTPDYIKNIKNDVQTAIYFHGHNRIVSKQDRLHGIIYDVIRKPSIRRKKSETPSQFMRRLSEYYTSSNESELFYMETIEKPLLSDKRVFSTLEHVAEEIRNCLTEDDFYPNDRHCYVRSRCNFYDICHFGENAVTMARYRPKQKSDQ